MEQKHSEKCLAYIEKDGKCTCDGYHTFNELYDHRIILFISLCKLISCPGNWGMVWASTKHSDNSSFGDWFVLGMNKEKGEQITYHLPAKYWEEVCEFAQILDKAPEWDGHTSDDVLERLKYFPNLPPI